MTFLLDGYFPFVIDLVATWLSHFCSDSYVCFPAELNVWSGFPDILLLEVLNRVLYIFGEVLPLFMILILRPRHRLPDRLHHPLTHLQYCLNLNPHLHSAIHHHPRYLNLLIPQPLSKLKGLDLRISYLVLLWAEFANVLTLFELFERVNELQQELPFLSQENLILILLIRLLITILILIHPYLLRSLPNCPTLTNLLNFGFDLQDLERLYFPNLVRRIQ